MKVRQYLQHFSVLLILLFVGTTSTYAQRTDLENYCSEKATANNGGLAYYRSCLANIEADRKYLQRQQDEAVSRAKERADLDRYDRRVELSDTLRQRMENVKSPQERLALWAESDRLISNSCKTILSPKECEDYKERIRSELLECAECAYPKTISKAEKERLKRESESCIGTGCPVVPVKPAESTVAECVGWLGAFMLADTDISNRKEKGFKSSAGTKPQGEAAASVSKHPMASQVKALAEKNVGDDLQITINKKIRPEIEKLFPQVAADFPGRPVSEQALIALQRIEKKASATCADAGETGIRFISISTASGGVAGKSSSSNQTRQINRQQAKDLLIKELTSTVKKSEMTSELRKSTECIANLQLGFVFTPGVVSIDETSLKERINANTRKATMEEIAPCLMAAMPIEVQRNNVKIFPMSTDDFRLDYPTFKGKKVNVEGEVMFAMNIYSLRKNNVDMSPIPIDVSKLPRQELKKILEKCAAINSECKGSVYGVPGRVLNQNGIIVESIQWKE